MNVCTEYVWEFEEMYLTMYIKREESLEIQEDPEKRCFWAIGHVC